MCKNEEKQLHNFFLRIQILKFCAKSEICAPSHDCETVTFRNSGLMCHISCVMFHMSGVTVHMSNVFFFYKMVELVGGGSVINEVCPV